MEITQERHKRSTSSQSSLSFWAWPSSLSWWAQSLRSSAHLTTSMTWSSRSWTHSTCGLRKLRSLTSLSISNRLCTTTSGNTSSKLSFTISTSSLRSSTSISKSRRKCRQTWFKTLESSRSLNGPSIISSTSVSAASPMNSSLTCSVVSSSKTRLSSATRATSRRCSSSDKVLCRCSTMTTMRRSAAWLSSIFPNTLTSAITRSSANWSLT